MFVIKLLTVHEFTEWRVLHHGLKPAQFLGLLTSLIFHAKSGKKLVTSQLTVGSRLNRAENAWGRLDWAQATFKNNTVKRSQHWLINSLIVGILF